MSILDDAIREHLELKRAHGADDAELKKLEDEAFGPPARPGEDPLGEAPTEFLAAPAMDVGQAEAEANEEGGRRAPNITDLQEPPEPPAPAEDATDEEAVSTEEPAAEAPEAPAAEAPEEPAIESGPSTEERSAIAEQPTEFFDVEAELDAGAERPSPTDEQLLDSQLAEPRLAPVEPPGPIDISVAAAEAAEEPALADEDEEDDDFFSEQRLSDELNNALETPVDDEAEVFAPSEPAPPMTDEHEALHTDEHEALHTDEHEALETDEHELEPVSDEHETPSPSEEQPLSPITDEHDEGPYTDEHELEPPSEEATAIYNLESDEDEDDDGEDEEPRQPASEHEDVLEDTPDFLEDAPEDDNLWFEQQPPKDFDFDD